MKKLYILLVTIIACVSHPICLLAQEDEYIDADQVPEAVMQKFSLLYLAENKDHIQWEFEHGGYEAYIKNPDAGNQDVAFFASNGKLEYRINTAENGLRTGTEKEIMPEALSEVIREQLDTNTIKAIIEELDTQEKPVAYRIITTSGQEFSYDSKGKALIEPEKN